MHSHHQDSASISRRRNQAHEQIQRALKQSLARLKPRRVLDVGTGFGISVEFLARRFVAARIWSIDASREVLREVRRALKGNRFSVRVVFKQAKAEALPFKARHFDLVVSLLSLHHFSNPAKGLREMGRVLSHDGKLIVADWRPTKSPVVPHSAKDIPSPRFVTLMLKRLGYSTVLHQGHHWYLLEATNRRLERNKTATS